MDPASVGPPSLDQSLTRRHFLAAAGIGVLGTAVLGVAGCGTGATSPSGPTRASFHSRPDLTPPLVATTVSGPLADGLIFLTGNGPLIVDNHGSPIWYQPLPSGTSVADFKIQIYQGQPIMTWWQGSVMSPGFGRGVHVVMDRTYRQVRTIQAANGLQADLHDLQLTPQGTALITAYTTVTTDLLAIGGARAGTLLTCILQEIDLASGTVVFEWHSADHVDPSESHAVVPTSASQPFDYFHLNSVDVGPDGNLLISARNTWALYKLDRRTGAVIWRLGGKRSDFTLGTGVHFAFQHDARWHGTTDLTLFDDGAGPPNVEAQSSGLRLRIDEAARTAELAQQFLHLPETLASSQGNLQQLENGNVFVGWGSQPYATEHTASGGQVFAAQMATAQSYRAFRTPWTGAPAAAPVIAARRAGSGALDVYASWNGATEVASWEVVAGSSSGAMTAVATAPRNGFETRIHISTAATMVAARALDRSGNLLAVSATVNV